MKVFSCSAGAHKDNVEVLLEPDTFAQLSYLFSGYSTEMVFLPQIQVVIGRQFSVSEPLCKVLLITVIYLCIKQPKGKIKIADLLLLGTNEQIIHDTTCSGKFELSARLQRFSVFVSIVN